MATSGSIYRSILLVVIGLLTGILGLHPHKETSRNESSNQCARVCPGAESCILSNLDGRFFFRCVRLDGQEQIIPYEEPDANTPVETGPIVQTFLLSDQPVDEMTAQDLIRGLMQTQIQIQPTEIVQPNVIDQPLDIALQNEVIAPSEIVIPPSQEVIPPSFIRKANMQVQTIVQPSVILQEIGRRQAAESSPETMPAQPEARQRPGSASRIGHSLRKALQSFKMRSRNGNGTANPSVVNVPIRPNLPREQIRVTFHPAVPFTAPPTFKVPSGNQQCEYCDSADQCKDEARPYCFHSHSCARRICQSL